MKPATSLAKLIPFGRSEFPNPKLDVLRELIQLEKNQGKEGGTPRAEKLLKLTFGKGRNLIKNEANLSMKLLLNTNI